MSAARRAIHWIGAIVLAAACGGDSTGPDNESRDTISFSYSGARSGTFSASSSESTVDPWELVLDGKPAVGRGLDTETDPTQAYAYFYAFRPNANGSVDILEFAAPPRVGTHQVGLGCGDASGLSITFGYDINEETDDFFENTFFFIDCGTVIIDEYSDTAVRGRFFGKAETFFSETEESIQIASGTFTIGRVRQGGVTGAVCQVINSC